MIALFYAEEDWRGRHDWEKFKREWEAKGEKFDYASVIPPPVPDDQNFALTPVIASSYERFFDKSGHAVYPRNTNVVDRLTMITWSDNQWAHLPGSGGWQESKKTDLKAWQDYFPVVAAKRLKGNQFLSGRAAAAVARRRRVAGVEQI